MKKTPYFTGTLLAVGGVVVALNWGRPNETPTTPLVPSTLSRVRECRDGPSIFGMGHGNGTRTAGSAIQPVARCKAALKKSPKVQSTIKNPPKSTAGKILKRQPTVVNVSGHIL